MKLPEPFRRHAPGNATPAAPTRSVSSSGALACLGTEPHAHADPASFTGCVGTVHILTRDDALTAGQLAAEAIGAGRGVVAKRDDKDLLHPARPHLAHRRPGTRPRRSVCPTSPAPAMANAPQPTTPSCALPRAPASRPRPSSRSNDHATREPQPKHEPTRVELILRWRGWYQAYDVYYICSCGRRLKEHGDHTITHFQPETKATPRCADRWTPSAPRPSRPCSSSKLSNRSHNRSNTMRYQVRYQTVAGKDEPFTEAETFLDAVLRAQPLYELRETQREPASKPSTSSTPNRKRP